MEPTVEVYFNLRTHLWSVRVARKVVAHHADMTLYSVTFKVSEATRQWVIRKGQRSVHAWAIGTIASTDASPKLGVRVTYNPYRAPTFTVADTGAPITRADAVTFHADGTAWAINPS